MTNVFPCTAYGFEEKPGVWGRESMEDRKRHIQETLFKTFEELHCDFRIDIDQIEEEWQKYKIYRNKE